MRHSIQTCARQKAQRERKARVKTQKGRDKMRTKNRECQNCGSEMMRFYSKKGGLLWICGKVKCLTQYDNLKIPRGCIFCAEATEKNGRETNG